MTGKELYLSPRQVLDRLKETGTRLRIENLAKKLMEMKSLDYEESLAIVSNSDETKKKEIESSYSVFFEEKTRKEAELKTAEEEAIRKEELKKEEEYKKQIELENTQRIKDEKEKRMLRVFDSIPSRYKDAEISDFNGSLIEKSISEVLSSNRNWLCLGMNGVGKTRLAYAFIKEWATRDESSIYITAPEFSAEIRSVIMKGDNVCVYLDNKYGGVSHLIIDEIDKLKGNENDLIYLSYVINSRYSNEKQTVILGNKGDMKPEDILGASASSRMKDDGAIRSVYWRDKDRRTEK